MAGRALPPRLQVYTSEACFLLQPPREGGIDFGCLCVDRATAAVTHRGALSDSERRSLPTPVAAAALLGVLPLPGAAAVALVTRRERAATLACGAPLWRAAACAVLLDPPAATAPTAAADEAARERYAALLRLALAEPGLYYSDEADATRCEQNRCHGCDANTSSNGEAAALCSRADPRFFWNAALAVPVAACPGGAAFVAPLFCGFAAEAQLDVDSESLVLTLLARRHVGRPGRRLWARGVDAAGAAANCVETEQVLRNAKADAGAAAAAVSCHVSVRGSVPLLWAQPPDLRPKPRIRLSGPGASEARAPGPWPASLAAYRAHMAALRVSYGGPVAALSLLRHRGREAPLSDAYAAAAAAEGNGNGAGDVHVAFDFNAQRGAAPEGRAALLALLLPHLRAAAFFYRPAGVSNSNNSVSRQRGVLRINCLDCLDRTNMAQAAAAAVVAATQLRALRGGESGTAVAADQEVLPPALRDALSALWRAHGDALAQQYTRTGAQRRDRSAKPGLLTAVAAARDALISLRRYVQNNHGDAAACDAAALLAGAHAPASSSNSAKAGGGVTSSPFPRSVAARAAHAGRRAPLLQALMLLCAGRCGAALRSLAALSGDLSGATAVFTLWAAATLALGHVALRFGHAFVARPLFALEAQATAQ